LSGGVKEITGGAFPLEVYLDSTLFVTDGIWKP